MHWIRYILQELNRSYGLGEKIRVIGSHFPSVHLICASSVSRVFSGSLSCFICSYALEVGGFTSLLLMLFIYPSCTSVVDSTQPHGDAGLFSSVGMMGAIRVHLIICRNIQGHPRVTLSFNYQSSNSIICYGWCNADKTLKQIKSWESDCDITAVFSHCRFPT